MDFWEQARDLSRRLHEAYDKMNNEIVSLERDLTAYDLPARTFVLYGGGRVDWTGTNFIFVEEGRRIPLRNSPKDVRIEALQTIVRTLTPS